MGAYPGNNRVAQMRRQILNAVLSPTPNRPLYHYTNQKGLMGIVGSKSIWVTHTQYLNDRREFVHAVDFARIEIEKRLDTEPAGVRRVKLEAILKELFYSPASINVCVCSFSERRDSLSQWRAYGPFGTGFAIGISPEVLVDATRRKDWYLAKCVYNPDEQRKIIAALIEEVLEQDLRGSPGFTAEQKNEEGVQQRGVAGNFLAYLNRYAPILKDESFSEEEEWRVITRPVSCESEDYALREGKTLLIPYTKLPLVARKDDELCLRDLVVGPTPDAQRSVSSVRGLLMHHRVEGASVLRIDNSRIPYRDW